MEVSEKKLAIAVGLVFLLGILFSIINGEYTEETGSSLPLVAYGIAVVSLAAGAFLVILFQWKINQKQLMRVLRLLPEDERKILELLVVEKKIDQSHLVAQTGFSKVKVSRVISKLHDRGIVDKHPSGNTNLVILNL